MNSDPRVFFAAERTLLAWVRSGVTVMALGFVVAKFGLFLTLIAASFADAHHGQQAHGYAQLFGVTLVLIGVVITLAAQYNHQCYIKTLPPADVPLMAISWLGALLSISIAIVGVLLAVYLSFS